MRLTFLYLIVAVIMLIPGAANAAPYEDRDLITVASYLETTKGKKLGKTKVFAKLRLPNVSALTKDAWKLDRSLLRKQQWKSATVLAFFKRNRWLTAPNKTKCWEVPWQRSCTIARASIRLHTALAEVATRRLLYELPATNDWVTAVRIAQRAYPGTDSWMLSISDREGGWGRWVWYSGACSSPPCYWQGYHVGGDNVSGADTVGGPMQFRWSTFAPYWRAARADLIRRGYLIPEMTMPPEGGPVQYAPWLSPLGQALTAGYMKYYDKEGCHWCLG